MTSTNYDLRWSTKCGSSDLHPGRKAADVELQAGGTAFVMRSLFMRALELGASAREAQSVASASRTTTDGTFAVSSGLEGVIRVYAASCAALLHEFTTIHRRIYTLHYTSFSDSLITLESDVVDEGDDEDSETFLCVYHDWRERKIVRGYTLPLGVLESPSSRRKADCIAVCSFTGRVVVAMGNVLNIWQCSHGFFEHVMELKVDMAQRHAYLQVEHVAIHGVYVAYASQTEVRVMEIHVQSSKEGEEGVPSMGLNETVRGDFRSGEQAHDGRKDPSDDVPEDADNCVCIASGADLDAFVEVSIPHSSYFTIESEANPRQQIEQRIFEEQEPAPMVLARGEAQQEAWNLAGLIKSQDIRTNQAMSYFIGENDVTVLLRRYLPPNHCVTSLKFLPETIDNRFSVETRSYTRLLIATELNAFLYYFLSEEVDTTRKKMSKKVLGKGERTRSSGMLKPIKVGRVLGGGDSFVKRDDEDGETDEIAAAESGRVVMHYAFTSPVTCIEANSSFLFVATLTGLQVWSIWSPCHYVAASRALSTSLVPQPSQPQLLCTQPVPFLAVQIAALDSYVVILPAFGRGSTFEQIQLGNTLRAACLTAAEKLPHSDVEVRRSRHSQDKASSASVLVFQQCPPSLIFSSIHDSVISSSSGIGPDQIDLLLSLFSLYRYRADIGFDLLETGMTEKSDVKSATTAGYVFADRKELVALQLETSLYDKLAKDCAGDLAAIFMSERYRNLERAALLYVASNVSSIEVMQRLQDIMGTVDRSEVVKATGKYLEAFAFPPPPTLGSLLADNGVVDKAGSGQTSEFTRTVLLHYDKYFPEQLARLVIDSSLQWTLQDLSFAFEKLTEATSDSVLVEMARLVLVLKASSSPEHEWDAFKAQGYSQEPSAFVGQCSRASVSSMVKRLFGSHIDALRDLVIGHPHLLLERARIGDETDEYSSFSSSILASVIAEIAPAFFEDILEQIFTGAVGRHETLHSVIWFCFAAIGEAATPSLHRMFGASKSRDTSDRKSLEQGGFTVGRVFVIRFLVFVLGTFPGLEGLAEKDEVRDDEDTLRHIKSAVAIEFIRQCYHLTTCFQSQGNEIAEIGARLVELFVAAADHSSRHRIACAQWVQEYLEKRCLFGLASESKGVLKFLLNEAVELAEEKDLCDPVEILSFFQAHPQVEAPPQYDENSWTVENDFGALIILLVLPRLSRSVIHVLNGTWMWLMSNPIVPCYLELSMDSSLLRLGETLSTCFFRTGRTTAARWGSGAF